MYSQVDKPLRPAYERNPVAAQDQDDQEPIEIQVDGEEPDHEEPGDEPEVEITDQEFDGNLAEHIDKDETESLSGDLISAVDEDIKSRSEWTKLYEDSLKYIGLKGEEERTRPWQGACGVTHPLMLEAIVRFQSRLMPKLFSARGPADIDLKSKRVPLTAEIQTEIEITKSEFNTYLSEQIPEFLLETDRMLFSLADIGFSAEKVTFDRTLGRNRVQFVKAENFILPYGTDNLETCPRFTEEVRRTSLDVENLKRTKYYLDIDLIADQDEDMGDVEKAKSYLLGQTPSALLSDAFRIYEIYVDMYFDQDEFKSSDESTSPYVISVEKESGKILRIGRNWDQTDEKRRKKLIFSPFFYVPGDGSMGYGLVHLVGQLAGSATKLLRQLVDAGTLANLPAFLKSRMARMTNVSTISPGEFRDVELDPEQLSKAFFQLQYKEPSQVLFLLYQDIVSQGKSFSSTADLDISASSQNAPVGTTLALIERQTEVQNAIQTRFYNSFGRVLNMIVDNIRRYDNNSYLQIFGKLEQMVGKGNFKIFPTGDPTSATASQQIIQLQGIAQMSVQAPQVFNMTGLYRRIVSAMGIPNADEIVPDKSASQPMGLVEEQMAFLMGKPVQCYPFYDHQAHIQAHMALMNDPLYHQIMAQNPQAQSIVGAIQSDIAQHLAYDYRDQIQKQLGTQLPPIGQTQPPQVEAALSQLVAKAADQVRQVHAAQASQQAAAQQQADPAYQLEKEDLRLKEKDIDNKHQAKMRDQQLKEQAHNDNTDVKVLQIEATRTNAETAQEYKIQKDLVDHDHQQTVAAIDIGKRLMDTADLHHQIDNQPEPQAPQQ